MPSITLKDIPRALHRDLKARAKANHRSLNKEVIATLRAGTASAIPLDLSALEETARRTRALFKQPVTARQITTWKRTGRL
jgi:plasmid stability protein